MLYPNLIYSNLAAIFVGPCLGNYELENLDCISFGYLQASFNTDPLKVSQKHVSHKKCLKKVALNKQPQRIGS